MSARYIDHEDDIDSLEDVRDVVEWNSPDVGSQAQVEYCEAVVSSPDRVQAIGKKERVLNTCSSGR